MEFFKFSTEDRIGYLTLNRNDKYNAFHEPMVKEFKQFLEERQYDDSVGVIILEGGDAKGFCAGLDMDEYAPAIFSMPPLKSYNAQAEMSRLFVAMRRIPQPIICCVHGAAAGIGFSLAMASDIRILADDARFSAAYIKIGLGGADMASSYFLPRLIGSGRAYEFLLTGNWMSADEAMNLGFGSRKVPKAELIPTAEKLAKTMMERNPMGIQMTKEAINANIDVSGMEAALQLEDRNQMMMSYTFKMA
ncbi:MAG: enoyl-CoA hydratase/isomerase family protein [Myxococcota bacterium]|nr:enoyl-CoA hydratase/isomerase family protein [Myxococcota bacterium]